MQITNAQLAAWVKGTMIPTCTDESYGNVCGEKLYTPERNDGKVRAFCKNAHVTQIEIVEDVKEEATA